MQRRFEGKHNTLKSKMLWDDHWKRMRRQLVKRHVPQELNPTAPYPDQVLPTVTVTSGLPYHVIEWLIDYPGLSWLDLLDCWESHQVPTEGRCRQSQSSAGATAFRALRSFPSI